MTIEELRVLAEKQAKRLWFGRYMQQDKALLMVYYITGNKSVLDNDFSKLNKNQCYDVFSLVKKKIFELNGCDLV